MTNASTTVGIVVLSWNRRARVLACVARLQRLTGVVPTIIVVDNASSDDSVDALRRAYPDVALLPQATNLGFVGGVNAGLREARRRGLSYAWLLNDDTHLEDDVLAKLLAFAAAHPTCSLFSPVVRDDDDRRALQFANGIVDWQRSRLHDEAPADRFDAMLAAGGTPVLIGTALLVDLRVVTVEGFDPHRPERRQVLRVLGGHRLLRALREGRFRQCGGAGGDGVARLARAQHAAAALLLLHDPQRGALLDTPRAPRLDRLASRLVVESADLAR